MVTAPVRREAAPSWRLTLPFVPHPGHALFSAGSFILGMTLLSLAWIRLGAFTIDRSQTTRRRLCIVLAAAALWTAPILLSPPLLSNDVYSYAAQGELASRGVDPTVVGPNALGGGPFMRAADAIWWNNPAPYGPAWNKIAETVVVATDHDAALSVWALRGVVVLALIIAGFALYDLTRAHNPALALAMGIVNPVVLVHLVGGIHNDAVMIALMMVALACARRSWFLASVVFMTLATAVKLPAAAGLVYLGWHAPYVRAEAQRFVAAAATLFVGLISSVVLSFAWGMSLGWVSALKGTGKVMSTFAPTTMLGLSLSDAFSAVGIEVDPDHAVALSRLVGLLGAGAHRHVAVAPQRAQHHGARTRAVDGTRRLVRAGALAVVRRDGVHRPCGIRSHASAGGLRRVDGRPLAVRVPDERRYATRAGAVPSVARHRIARRAHCARVVVPRHRR